MAINIIERAVTPYNSSANKVANKEQYSLYAPAANVNKPGMAGYDPTYFAVREQIVELSAAFLASIMHHVVMTGDIPVDGIKETNTVYSCYTHEVIDRRTVQGAEEKITVTGNLLVLRAGNCITEILFAEGRSWTRRMFVNGLTVQSVSAFEPAFDKSVTYDQLAVDAVGTRNIKDANVTTIKIKAKAITTDKINDEAVTTEKIADAAVTTDKIDDESIVTEKIASKAVTNDKLDDEIVTTEKIADAAVTNEKLDDAVITTEKIVGQAVTTDKLKNEAVTTEKLGKSSVTAEKIYAGSVNETKLSAGLLNRLLALESDAFTDISYNADNGVLTFTTTTGEKFEVDLPLELIVSGGRYDEKNQNLVLTLSNGDEIAIPLDDVTKDFIAYVDGIRESIYVLQKAPPLAALADAVLLTTPTLAVVAGLT